MTYKEAYMNCKSLEELQTMANKDIKIALLINKDRLKPIEVAINEVCKTKKWRQLNES